MSIDLNKFAVEVHENAKSHGWWDTQHPFGETAALIHSEWSEALEEYRADRPMVWKTCGIDGMTVCGAHQQPNEWCGLDSDMCVKRGAKPEGIAVELIDGAIRILDYLGYTGCKTDCGETVDEMIERLPDARRAECETDNFPSFVTALHLMTSKAVRKPTHDEVVSALRIAEAMVYRWVKRNGEDPEALLLEKHAYNITRPYKHGKVC